MFCLIYFYTRSLCVVPYKEHLADHRTFNLLSVLSDWLENAVRVFLFNQCLQSSEKAKQDEVSLLLSPSAFEFFHRMILEETRTTQHVFFFTFLVFSLPGKGSILGFYSLERGWRSGVSIASQQCGQHLITVQSVWFSPFLRGSSAKKSTFSNANFTTIHRGYA